MQKEFSIIPSMDLFHLAPGQKYALATADLQAQTVRAAMRLQIEMLGFVRNRLKQDIKLVDDLVESDAFNDAFDVVCEFAQNAAMEYTSEAGKMALVWSRITSEAARGFRKQSNDALEDRAATTIA
jgi:hypothetical protein